MPIAVYKTASQCIFLLHLSLDDLIRCEPVILLMFLQFIDVMA